MGVQMGFVLAIKLIRQIKDGQIGINDLPYASLRESDVALIMGVHGHLYQQIPRHFKTAKVIRSTILGKSHGVKMVGHQNITDELACLAIDKWGKVAFMVMNDLNKTAPVALHAIRNHPIAYKDIKKGRRTQEMSDLAFDLNHGLIYNIPSEHLTTKMILACIPHLDNTPRIEWPAHVITQEVVDCIASKGPSYSTLIPDHLLTPEILAQCARMQPERIGSAKNPITAIKAIRYSLESLATQTLVTQAYIDSAEAKVDQGEVLAEFLFGPKQKQKPSKKPIQLPPALQALQGLVNAAAQKIEPSKASVLNRLGLYAMLYRLNADDPEKLASSNEHPQLLPDLIAALHGARVAVKYFPKAPNRGLWLEQELGL